MSGEIFYEQGRIATEFELIEVPNTVSRASGKSHAILKANAGKLNE